MRSKSGHIVIGILKGPVTAAFRREGRRWLCTALEFDIVGIGATRDEARAEMQALVKAYLENVIKKPGPVEFFNQSDAEEAQTEDKEHFLVAIAYASVADETAAPSAIDARSLGRYRDRIRDMNLIPIPDVPLMVGT